MTIYAYILGEAPVHLWGLSSRDRLQRMLKQANVQGVVDDLGSLPADSSVVIVRGAYLFDNRVIGELVKSQNVVLRLHPPEGRVSVAAHVPASLASQLKAFLLEADAGKTMPGLRIETPETLTSAYDESLRNSNLASVDHISPENQQVLEQKLFSGSYKGVTDLVTKWLWPVPAQWITRLCVRTGIKPNHVTGVSLVLVVIAGTFFAYGLYWWGLLAGWVMTFLDTVDGKLARVTITSSRFGHFFDHGLDLIHPPLWYIAWGLGLPVFFSGIPGLSLEVTFSVIVIGYIIGRLVEGAFQLLFGAFGIFCWRPFDSYFRLITARRNPNLILLTGSIAISRPDLGLTAVALWTALSSLLLVLRLVLAGYARITSGPLRSWMADIDFGAPGHSLAMRLFTIQPLTQMVRKHE